MGQKRVSTRIKQNNSFYFLPWNRDKAAVAPASVFMRELLMRLNAGSADGGRPAADLWIFCSEGHYSLPRSVFLVWRRRRQSDGGMSGSEEGQSKPCALWFSRLHLQPQHEKDNKPDRSEPVDIIHGGRKVNGLSQEYQRLGTGIPFDNNWIKWMKT